MHTIFLASDHAGVELKANLISYIQKGTDLNKSYECLDLGTDSETSCDYPDYAKALCQKVLESPNSLGVLICGTGIGMSISANRFPGIRAALCTHEFQAKVTRQHNNANVLCLGARVSGEEICKEMLKNFLNTEFEAGRHLNRINKIEEQHKK